MLNPVFAETNEPLQLKSSSLDTSFTQISASSSDFDEEDDLADERNETHDSYGEDDEQEDDHPPTHKKSKLVVAPHKKVQQMHLKNMDCQEQLEA